MYQGPQNLLLAGKHLSLLHGRKENTMSAMRTPSLENLVAELHAAVKAESSVPKVAEAIGMNYYSLRDNLMGKSDIRLKTVYAILDVIGLSMEELTQRALLREERSED
jgi:DNA-binding phage protein